MDRPLKHRRMERTNALGRWGRWICRDCGREGTLSELALVVCDRSSPLTDAEVVEMIEGPDTKEIES